jgi:hypothetical protein
MYGLSGFGMPPALYSAMNRNTWMVLAVVLLALGVGSFLLQGVSWVSQETILDAGPLEVTVEQEERVGFPAWVSVLLAAGGVGALIVGLAARPE